MVVETMQNLSPEQLIEQLLDENLITADRCEAVLHEVKANGGRVEDVLIESGVIAEYDLLKYLAKVFRTRFVVTAKLARVDLDRGLLELIPRAIAEKFAVFPVLFDPTTQSLSVVSANAGDASLSTTIQEAANVREVRVFVGRPAAVKAAIQKHYGGDIYAFAQADTTGREQYMSLLELYDRGNIQINTAPSVAIERPRERMISERDLASPTRGATAGSSQSTVALLETTNVLISLLENSRGDLRGHSAIVSRWVRKLAERIRITETEAHALALAGLLHDVGKAATYHLTALNVAQFESHKQTAQKSYMTPLRLFEAVQLDNVTMLALKHMYERFDGGGFPDGLSGKEIPLGARLLALVDTYADLTQNARNPYRRTLTSTEACDVIDRQKSVVFDPNLVDLLRHSVTGDDLRARLLADRPGVLVVDPDPEESAVIELRLLEEGFDVRTARNAEEAIAALSRGAVEVCITETDLDGMSGFDMVSRARNSPVSQNVLWVFLTRDSQRDSIAKGFELGASDYVIKPAPGAVLVAKVRQLLAQRTARQPRGVSGSLSELALTDVVQVLAQGRKTGQLRVRDGNEQGEIHFQDGQIVNALWPNLRGEEAFYVIQNLVKGEFAFDPSFRPTARVINASVDALMLEGARRFDERQATR
jgi:response regulator RpfG family c-di-GMP phosphodiesterase